MNNTDQTSGSTDSHKQEVELRAKRNRKSLLIAVLISYAINMAIGTYFMFTKQHQDAVTHVMLANISCIFLIDRAIK
jgi:hypothetical protein